MSDSEDDISVSGSEAEEDDDVEMEDADQGGDDEVPVSDGDPEDNDAASDVVAPSKWFQKELWQHRKLPYYPELELQANKEFADIKAGLAYSVMLNDPQIGLLHWILEIERYIDHYGRRFSKEDHVTLIRLMLPFVKKNNIFRDVKVAAHCVNMLLCKRDYLLRGDIVIDWKPLFELYIEVAFKNLEEDGVFLLPEGFKNELYTLIFYARNYFSDDSVQEILDRVRPYICIWDESMIRAYKLLELFLPMNFAPSLQAVKGACLWFDEAWHFYSTLENNNSCEPQMAKMFARLCYDTPGYIEWTDAQLDLIFGKLLRSLRLNNYIGFCQTFSMETAALWITYMLGTKVHENVMQRLQSMFRLIESFIHPSNNGQHTQHLLNMIHKLLHNVVLRIKRERNEKPSRPRTCNRIPQWMRLQSSHSHELVKMMLPCIKLAIFTKSRQEFVTPMLKNACSLEPKLVLPEILDIVYPALETIIEPHRLVQALQALVSVSISLVRDQPTTTAASFRVHAITLMNSLVPGLDRNDIGKTMITFQVIGVLVNLIPLVDCSDAVHMRNDLTEDEKELCSATANFENIIAMFIDKLLSMLLDCGESAVATGGHGGINTKTKNNVEDSVLHRGTISVFKGMCKNSSTPLYKVAVNQLYNFACEHVFDSRVAADALADMVQVAVKYHPEESFSRFFKLIKNRLHEHVTPDTYKEEQADFHVIWWLTMAVKVMRVPSTYILRHWVDVKEVLELILPLKRCTLATRKSLLVFESVLDALSSIYVADFGERKKQLDRPLDEWLPIRHWAAPADKRSWQPGWHIPTAESIARTTELLKLFAVPNIAALESPGDMDKKELLHRLLLLRYTFTGSCYSLPFFDLPTLPLHDSPVFMSEHHKVVRPEGTPEITLDGRNVRLIMLECLKKVLDHIFANCEDDVKSIEEVVLLLSSLRSNRGVSRDSFNQSAQNYRMTKMVLSERLSGNKNNIEMLSEEYLNLLHRKRVVTTSGYQFTQAHSEILQLLVRVGSSFYSQNRIKAQNALTLALKDHPYSYQKVVEPLLYFLDKKNNVTHEQMKGALHMLVDGKRLAIVLRMSFRTQIQIWPAIIGAQHSEKPSIIDLMEVAQNTIVDNYESYRVNYEISDKTREMAAKLMEPKEASPMNPRRDYPTDEQIATNKNRLLMMSEKATREYYELADQLLQLSQDPELHWRQVDMSQAMLSLLVRRDVPYPVNALKACLKLLLHDALKTRKMATAVVSSWLRMNKPKAVKRPLILEQCDNTGPGARWPIKYGYRDDNRALMYEEEKLPTTDEEWNSFQFCGKQHFGFYTWPEALMTYAPLKDQVNIDRDESAFSEIEQHIVDTLRDPQFATKMRELFSVEQKKGDDTFNAVEFSFFQGLFRCFNDALCMTFKEHLEILVASTKESDQKLAAEMVAAIVNGSKLWKWERQKKLWIWLAPLLTRALESVKDDSMRNWGVCIATICGSSEARMLKPLLDILFDLIKRNNDNAFAFNARLFILQGALCQFEWRAISLWRKLFELIQPEVVQHFANLRDRLAVCLVTATWFDLPTVFVSQNLATNLKPVTVEEVIAAYDSSLGPCWEEARFKCDYDNNGGPVDEAQLSEVKRHSRRSMKGLISFVYNQSVQSYVALQDPLVKLLPLLCHYSNDVGDEELQRSCVGLTKDVLQSVFLNPTNAVQVIDIVNQVMSSTCWWRTKVALIKMLQVLVFANFYVYKHHRDEIGTIVVDALLNSQIEVREAATNAFAGLLQAGYFDVTDALVTKFTQYAANMANACESHGGVLGLSAIVRAFPYSVPSFLPEVLMRICRYASFKEPVRDTVKKALSEFKRTHQDSWREHESQFNEDQLSVLRDLLVSPNYYV